MGLFGKKSAASDASNNPAAERRDLMRELDRLAQRWLRSNAAVERFDEAERDLHRRFEEEHGFPMPSRNLSRIYYRKRDRAAGTCEAAAESIAALLQQMETVGRELGQEGALPASLMEFLKIQAEQQRRREEFALRIEAEERRLAETMEAEKRCRAETIRAIQAELTRPAEQTVLKMQTEAQRQAEAILEIQAELRRSAE